MGTAYPSIYSTITTIEQAEGLTSTQWASGTYKHVYIPGIGIFDWDATSTATVGDGIHFAASDNPAVGRIVRSTATEAGLLAAQADATQALADAADAQVTADAAMPKAGGVATGNWNLSGAALTIGAPSTDDAPARLCDVKFAASINPFTGTATVSAVAYPGAVTVLAVSPNVTTSALPAYTYAAGVITMTATGVVTADGHALALNDLVGLCEAPIANQPYNGPYKVTTAGAVGAACVLTRCTEADSAAELEWCSYWAVTGTNYANYTAKIAVGTIASVGTTPLPVVLTQNVAGLAAEVVRAEAAEAELASDLATEASARAAADDILTGEEVSGGVINPTAAYQNAGGAVTLFCKDPFTVTGPIKAIPIYLVAAGSVEFALVKLIAANTFTGASWAAGILTLTTATAHGVPSGANVTISGLTSSNSVVVNGKFATLSGTKASTINIAISSDPGTIGYSSGALAAGVVVGETYEYTASASGAQVVTEWHPVVAVGWYLTAYIEGTNHTRYDYIVGTHSYSMPGRAGESAGAIEDDGNVVYQFGWIVTSGLAGETISNGGAEEAIAKAVLQQAVSTPTTIAADTSAWIKSALVKVNYSDADATTAVNNTIIPNTTPDYISALQFIQPAWADRNGSAGYAQSNEFSGNGGSPVITTQPYYNKMPDSTLAEYIANPGPDANTIRYEITDPGSITGERPLLVGGTDVDNSRETTFCESSNYAVKWAYDNWGVDPAKNIVYAFCGGHGGIPLDGFIKGTDLYTVFMDFFAQSQTYFHSQNLSYNVQTIPYIGHESVNSAATPDAYSWAEMFKKLAHDRSGDIANLTGQQTPAYTLGISASIGVLQGQAQQGMLKACLEDPLCAYVTPDYDVVRNVSDGTHYTRAAAIYLGAKIGRARAQIMGAPAYGIRGRKPDFLKPVSLVYYGVSKGSKVVLTFQAPGVLEFAQLTLAGATDWSDKPSGSANWAPRGLNLAGFDTNSLLSSDKTTAYNQMIIGSNGYSIEFTLDHDVPSSGYGLDPIKLTTGGCMDLYGLVVAPGLNILNGCSCDLRAHSSDVFHNPADGIDYPMHHLCPLFSMIATPAPSIPFSQYPDNEEWLRMMGLV